MSRTIRRKNCYKSSIYIVNKDDIDRWVEKEYGTKDPDAIVARSKAKFHRDHGSRKYDVSFMKMTGDEIRFQNKMELIRCLKMDCWDDHKPINFNANFYWIYW